MLIKIISQSWLCHVGNIGKGLTTKLEVLHKTMELHIISTLFFGNMLPALTGISGPFSPA